MNKKLKVWGGRKNGRERYIVAAFNQKEAAQIAGVTLSYLRGWWSITGNKEEIAQAMQAPLTLIRVVD